MTSPAIPEPDPEHTGRRRRAIRRESRIARRDLGPRGRAAASALICKHLVTSSLLLRHRRFSAFHAMATEVDLGALFAVLWRRRRQLYLPVMVGPALWFLEARQDTPLHPNGYGIPEPPGSARDRLPLLALDVMLMPLVAFDDAGHRIGMGGGYYDRTLAGHRASGRRGRPVRLGVAFEVQHHRHIPAQPWDVPLDGIVTERGLRWFPRPRADEHDR